MRNAACLMSVRKKEYRKATIYINEEYAKIQAEDKKKGDADLGGNTQDNAQDNTQDEKSEIYKKILLYCKQEKSKKEIAEYCGYKDPKSFGNRYLKPLIEQNVLELTLPDKLQSKNQKYRTK